MNKAKFVHFYVQSEKGNRRNPADKNRLFVAVENNIDEPNYVNAWKCEFNPSTGKIEHPNKDYNECDDMTEVIKESAMWQPYTATGKFTPKPTAVIRQDSLYQKLEENEVIKHFISINS